MNIYEPLSCLVITWTKGEGHPVTCQCRNTEEVEGWLHPFATLTLTRSERSAPRRGRFIPGIETRCTLYRRLGGPRGPVWMGAENLAVTGARSPDRPASSKSLYWLSYPVGSQVNAVGILNCLFTPFQVLDDFTDLHKTSYERFVTTGLPNGQTDRHAKGNGQFFVS